ncbi:hypothetical protein LJC56_01055 [Christensenellaceae bacterium OttesenSCG-928-K19]|nr:hypothetical protein [Christensenellaceae bacterium OttesenSCG-928-K19]
MIRSECAVVTFIDILGFKNLVEHKSDGEMVEILDLFHQHNSENPLSRYEISTPIVDNLISLKTVYFSDSVVRIRYVSDWGVKYPSDGHYMVLLEKELMLLAEIQAALLKRGILIRGGITIGEIYYDEEAKHLFGKAMNRAYELESTLANYPRIVIDPTFSNVYSPSMDFIESPISIDSEMLFSVDYFNEREAKLLLSDLKQWPEKRQKIIQHIKTRIISQKELMEEQRKALVKLLLQSTSGMRIDPINSPAEHLFRLQDVKVFGKHAWTVTQFNAAIDSWEKVRAEIGYNHTFVNKIFLRDFEWTDPNVLMDENSFSCLSSAYAVEDI